jgi:hypothetical protein
MVLAPIPGTSFSASNLQLRELNIQPDWLQAGQVRHHKTATVLGEGQQQTKMVWQPGEAAAGLSTQQTGSR